MQKEKMLWRKFAIDIQLCHNLYDLFIDPLWPSDATEIWVNIGSDNGLLTDGT